MKLVLKVPKILNKSCMTRCASKTICQYFSVVRPWECIFLQKWQTPDRLFFLCCVILFYTPRSRVLLEKLTVSQLVKKIPTFYGTRRFITAFTSAHHLSLSFARSIETILPQPTSWRFILILYSHLHLRLRSGLFPSGFSTKTLYTPVLSSHALYVPSISFFSILSPEQYWVRNADHCAHY